MSQHIEIEFKNMLTKEQYDELMRKFHVKDDDIQTFVNHYFDTKDEHLKNLHSGLRIRQINDYYECTLKEKTSEDSHLETNDVVTEEEANQILNGSFHLAPNVHKRLQHLTVPIEELRLFGSLTTYRVELNYKEGLLVLDHSKYLQEEDYEVEYETIDEASGRLHFMQFLQEQQIPEIKAPKKLARFAQALKKKGTL